MGEERCRKVGLALPRTIHMLARGGSRRLKNTSVPTRGSLFLAGVSFGA